MNSVYADFKYFLVTVWFKPQQEEKAADLLFLAHDKQSFTIS